jgi:hypothetical protein
MPIVMHNKSGFVAQIRSRVNKRSFPANGKILRNKDVAFMIML